jgi:hypothetical protein
MAEKIHFSNPMKPGELEAAYTQGMLHKQDLKDGAYYLGHCRNAVVAMWSASDNCFVYMRKKFSLRYPEKIFHPEDDNGFDLFIPLEKTIPKEDEIVREDHSQLKSS